MSNPRKTQAHIASARRKAQKRDSNKPKRGNTPPSIGDWGGGYRRPGYANIRSWFNHSLKQARKARKS